MFGDTDGKRDACCVLPNRSLAAITSHRRWTSDGAVSVSDSLIKGQPVTQLMAFLLLL